MAIGFNIQFRINEKTESRVIRLTDTSTGFTITKGIFSIVYPDGTSYSHTDLNNPDITSSGAYYDYQVSTDIYNNALTGQYVITFVGQDALLATNTLVRTIDFNWIKPTKSIINLSDTMIPEVKFQDSTVYTSSGSFTGVLTSRTFSVLMPTTSAVSGTTITAVSNIIDAIVSSNYYEGIYTPKSDIVATYTHNSLSTSLTVLYTALLEKEFSIKKAPTRLELITRINTFRAQVDAYKEANDTQFETLSEVYDILIALYMHLMERAQSSTLDGSQDILIEILNILDTYTAYSYQSGPISAFYIAPLGTGTVTSVGLTAPSAFTVSNSPVTISGSLTFTGAGSSLQYVDGTGSLQTFPTVLPANRMGTIGRNSTGATLYKGTIVYISGSTGNRPNFVKARANVESTSAGTFGVIFADIPNNTDGEAVTIGTIDTLDTRSNATHPFTTDTLVDGDTIYLSPTIAGYVTNVKPSAPNHLVYIGKVVRTTPQDGTIVYRIQNGYELDEIHDVQVGSYVDKDILYRDTTLNLWKNASIPTILGYTPYNATNPNNYIGLTALSSSATGLTYTNTTGVFTFSSGYAIPTTIKQSNWDDAYTWVAAFPTQTGNSGKFLTTNGSALSWATVTSGVSSFNTRTGAITLTSSDVTTALTYTPQAQISLTTTGSSGASTFVANTLNVPNYTLSGLGGQASSTNLTSLSGLSYVSASFVKMTAAGTFSLDTNTYYLASNPSGYTNNTGTVTSVAALTIGTTGTDLTSTVATGTTTPVITLNVPTASASNRGALSSADWTTFNNKQGALTLTTTGTSGAATLVGNTLNIPQYSGGGGGGTVTSVSITTANGISGTVATATTTPAITLTLGAITPTTVNGLTFTSAATGFTIAGGTTSKTLTVSNTLTLAGTDTSTLNIGTGGTLGSAAFTASTAYQASNTNLTSLAGLTFASTSFVKMTSAGTFALDTNTYYLASNPSGYTNNTGTVTSVAALTLGTTGTDLSSTVATGTTTPVITLNVPTASASNRGALSSADWSTFNGKQNTITLTTTGSSGSATFITNTLNIPTYTLAGLGGQASSTNLTSLSGLTFASTSFVKMTATGTFALDTNTYYLNSNPSGYTSNTGTVTSVSALTLGTTGTDLTSTVATGTTTPVITLNVPTASATNRGALSSTDWSAFNSKQGALTLTTTGSTGAATLIGNTLNIPQYSGGSGTVGTISRNVQNFTATASQTTFTISGGYTAGYIDVFVNGVRLTSADYTASNGTTVVMATGLLVGDIVDVMVYTGIALSGTAPISFNTSTGAISISQATTSTNGYLSSTDWNTFNGKQAALGYTPLNSSNPTYTGILGTGTLTYTPANLFLYAQQSVNSYVQTVFQNSNSGTTASTDIVVNNDLSTDTTYYGDFGINSSGFTGAGSLFAANNVYLTATTADLAIGTTTSNAIHFVINGSATDSMTIATTSQLRLPAYTTTTSFSGTVAGYLAFDSSGNILTVTAPTGGGGYTVTNQTTTYSVTATSGTTIVKADTTTAGFTITLPTAVGNTATVVIKKTVAANILTIGTTSSQTIDGGSTAQLKVNGASVTLISDNANWQII